MESLEVVDQQAGAVAVAPRVTIGDINAKIAREYFFTAGQAVQGITNAPASPAATPRDPLDLLTICVIVTTSGFTVTGESACASPENFNRELGEKFAREQAVRKLWSFEGYALRARLAND